MKNTLLSSALVAALVGAASALLVHSFVADERRAPESAHPAPAHGSLAGASLQAASTDSTELARQLRTLEAEHGELVARLEALERRPEPEARVALAPARASDSASNAKVDAAGLAPEVVQESVVQALESIRAEERAEAARAREQRELERIEERLTRASEQLGLAPGQTNDLRALLLRQRAEREALEAQREAGADRETYRAAVEEQRKRELAVLTSILTPAQFEAYQRRETARGDDRGRGRRGSTNTSGDRRGR
jgi:hypothetical protein